MDIKRDSEVSRVTRWREESQMLPDKPPPRTDATAYLRWLFVMARRDHHNLLDKARAEQRERDRLAARKTAHEGNL